MMNDALNIQFNIKKVFKPSEVFSNQKARVSFLEYKHSGFIILDSEFEDDQWILNNEYECRKINFKVSQNIKWISILKLSPNNFVDCLKCFAVYNFGRYSLKEIIVINNAIKKVFSTNPNELFKSKLIVKCCDHVIKFVKMISQYCGSDMKELLANLDICRELCKNSNPRELGSMESYFVFDDCIKKFWNDGVSDYDYIKYFPLYLWWELTCIVPKRPTEFILTPRNAVFNNHGKYYIRLRQSKLKSKASEDQVSYKISEDYSIVNWEITENIAAHIDKYISLTKRFDETDIGTLFIPLRRYNYKSGKFMEKPANAYRTIKHYKYSDLCDLLNDFYNFVIVEKYNYKIVDAQKKELNVHEISRIKLGDARHIAMINIMQSGGTATQAMILAGHIDIESGAHYYNNIKTMIKSKVHREYIKLKEADDYSLKHLIISNGVVKNGSYLPLSGNNKCFNPDIINNYDFSYCLYSIGPNDEISYCPNCKYFYASTNDVLKMYDRKLLEISEEYAEALKLVNLCLLKPVDILDVIKRLNDSSKTYYSAMVADAYEKYRKEYGGKNNNDK